jgi:hypothetical protein
MKDKWGYEVGNFQKWKLEMELVMDYYPDIANKVQEEIERVSIILQT